MKAVAPYAKAVTAAVVAALTAVSTGLDGGLSSQEIITAVLAFLVGLSAVWTVPNRPSA